VSGVCPATGFVPEYLSRRESGSQPLIDPQFLAQILAQSVCVYRILRSSAGSHSLNFPKLPVGIRNPLPIHTTPFQSLAAARTGIPAGVHLTLHERLHLIVMADPARYSATARPSNVFAQLPVSLSPEADFFQLAKVVASQIWDPQVASVECGMNKLVAALKLAETAFVLSLIFLPACSVALAQDSSDPPGEKPSEENSKTAYDAESDFTSGSACRGLVISDRPVVSNAGWISQYGFSDKNEVKISFDTGCASSTFFNHVYDRTFGSSRTNPDSSNPPRRRCKE
jgi:hypothetical protein